MLPHHLLYLLLSGSQNGINTKQVIETNMNERTSPEKVWTKIMHTCDSEIRQDPEREWNLLSSPPDMLYQIQTYYMALSAPQCTEHRGAVQRCDAPPRWNKNQHWDFFSPVFAQQITKDIQSLPGPLMAANECFYYRHSEILKGRWIWLSSHIAAPPTSSCICLMGLSPEAEASLCLWLLVAL